MGFSLPRVLVGALLLAVSATTLPNPSPPPSSLPSPPPSPLPSPPPGTTSTDLPPCPLRQGQNGIRLAEGEACRFEVRVVSGKYVVQNVERPALELERGRVYVFDVHSSAYHAFAMSRTPDGPAQYVETDGDGGGKMCESDGTAFAEHKTELNLVAGKFVFAPGLGTPSLLHYFCIYHNSMGGSISVFGGSAGDCAAGADADISVNSSMPFIAGGRTPSRHGLLVAHGVAMYAAFGILLPIAAFMARTGGKIHLNSRKLSLHRILAPLSMLVAVGGVSLAFLGVQREGGSHLSHSHGYIGLVLMILGVVVQPLAIASQQHSWHRRQGAAIIVGGWANLFQGMYLIRLPLPLQLAQIAILAMVVIVYVLYRPRPAGDKSEDPVTGASAQEAGKAVAIVPVLLPQAVPVRLPDVGQVNASAEDVDISIEQAQEASEAASQPAGEMAGAVDSLPKVALMNTQAEVDLLKVLPEAMRERRQGTDVHPGHLSRDDLGVLLADVLRKNRLQLSLPDREMMIEALLTAGDPIGYPFLSFGGLEQLLSRRGLCLGPAGALSRLPPHPSAPGTSSAPPNSSVPTQRNNEDNKLPSRMDRLSKWLHNNLPSALWVTLYIFANLLCFILYFAKYACWLEPANVHSCMRAPWAVCVAKGAGMALNFNCAIIVLPMSRHALTWLRSFRIIRQLMPLDSAYDAHMAIGWTIAGLTYAN